MAARLTGDRLVVHWIVEGVQVDEQGRWSSTMASNRYRTIAPAQWLSEQGCQVGCVGQHKWRVASLSLPDVAVVGKLRPYGNDPELRQRIGQHLLQQANELRGRGVALVADFCDDHFQHPTLGDYWRRLASVADVCVAGSRAMAEALASHTTAPIRLIGDPLASPAGEVTVFRKGPARSRWLRDWRHPSKPQTLRLVWYGDPSNWPAMHTWAEALPQLGEEQHFVLQIVTKLDERLQAFMKRYNAAHLPSARVELVDWTEARQWQAVASAHVVLIPVDLADPGKRVKSANRLTDALHAGRFVIASSLEAYSAYRDYVTLTDDPLAALRDYLRQPDEALTRICSGAEAVRAACSPAVIGAQWLAALEAACTLRSQH